MTRLKVLPENGRAAAATIHIIAETGNKFRLRAEKSALFYF